VLGASHDKEEVHYIFALDDRQLTITKDVHIKKSDTHESSDLLLKVQDGKVIVSLDGTMVVDESSDQEMMTKHLSVVSNKFSKFDLLIEEYTAQAAKRQKEKENAAKMKQVGRELQNF
jgi:hypothetical protein